MPLTLGPTITGVQGLIQHFVITPTTNPNDIEVQAWIDAFEAEVLLTIGDPTLIPAATAALLETFGRELVHKAAAGRTINAAIPERAYESETSYGDTLLKEYERGLKMLRDQRNDGLLTANPISVPGYGSARGSFPVSLGIEGRPL
jgi:hypothetical protein